jgi:uncharacterized Zn finger protein (UPF0148 family)
MMVRIRCKQCGEIFLRDNDDGWKVLCPQCWRKTDKYRTWRLRQGLPSLERVLGLEPR